MAAAMVVIRAVTMVVAGRVLDTFKHVHGAEADVRRITAHLLVVAPRLADAQAAGTLRDTK